MLLNSGYFDRYLAPFQAGRHLLQDFLEGKDRPGWPVPSDDLLNFLAKREPVTWVSPRPVLALWTTIPVPIN